MPLSATSAIQFTKTILLPKTQLYKLTIKIVSKTCNKYIFEPIIYLKNCVRACEQRVAMPGLPAIQLDIFLS